MPWIYLILPLSLFFSSLAYSDCSKLNFSQNFSINFQVKGGNNDQYLILTKNSQHYVNLWAAKSDNSSLFEPFIFEETLVDGVTYEILLYNEKSANSDLITYKIRTIAPAYSEWESDWAVASFSGEHDATGDNNDGLIDDTLTCSDDEIEPEEPIITDFCPYFPQPIQSWEDSGTSLHVSNSKAGTDGYHFGGWSQEYIDNNLSQVNHPDYPGNTTILNKLAVGFDSVTGWGNNDPNYQSCDVGGCIAGADKLFFKPPTISPTFPTSGSLDLSFSNFGNGESGDLLVLCPEDDSGSYCRYEGNDTVTIKSDLQSLTAQGLSNRTLKLRFEAGSGQYGRLIGSYQATADVSTEFLNTGTYTFNTITFSNPQNLVTSGNIVWQVNSGITLSGAVTHTTPSGSVPNPNNFTIYAPNNGAYFTAGPAQPPLYAHVLVDTMTNPSFTLHGALTTNGLTTNTGTVVGTSDCFSAGNEEDLYLEITEEKEFALLCENPEFTFTVRDAGNNNEIDTDYAGSIEVTLPSGISVDSVVKGSGSNGSYTPVDGELILSLSASSYGTYTIEGELSTDSSKDDSSELYVAPYKFDSDTVSAIAGNDTAFSLTVLACNDGSATKVSDYDGSKTLARSDITLEQPTSAQGGVTGNLTVAGTSSTSISFDFNNGAASSSLNYDESGAISFILSDSTFSCPTGFDCETDDGESWDSLQGVVNVNARPWTFAICEPNSHSMNGTASSGGGFVAAGENFTLNVLPIRYQGEARLGIFL
ncbi:hypothetical protein P7F88_01240 [Vibrio hannami]|uniref:DUF6701 domain-containing protein n=1 Tax=Vibrio hannami TaxID=2717094 RepID=UPI00240FBD61|nr:DUF6701 domain-containing protein [Vibrio hannami]MDG3084787.1 hypothetical protein [Vibrio hannami]